MVLGSSANIFFIYVTGLFLRVAKPTFQMIMQNVGDDADDGGLTPPKPLTPAWLRFKSNIGLFPYAYVRVRKL